MMKVEHVMGLDDETIKDNEQYYGWWTHYEKYESKGFELSIFFPKDFLPAATLQLWNWRLSIGWFF